MKVWFLAGSLLLGLYACGSDDSDSSLVPKNPAKVMEGDISSEPQDEELPVIANEIPADWTKIQEYGFSFFIPPQTEEVEVQGIDSDVGEFINDSCEFHFDYGMYCQPAENPDELISGKRAKISTEDREDTDYPFAAYLNFESIDKPGLNLSMNANCKTASDLETAKILFRSVQFD